MQKTTAASDIYQLKHFTHELHYLGWNKNKRNLIFVTLKRTIRISP